MGESTGSKSSSGLISAVGDLMDRRRERFALLLVALTATVASFAEALILVVVSLGGLRLSQDTAAPVALPLGLPLDELETRLLIVAGFGLLAFRLLILLVNAYIGARLSESVIYRWRRRLFLSFQRSDWEHQAHLADGYLQTLNQTHVNRVATALQQLTRAVTAGTSFATFVIGAIVISPIAAVGLAAFGIVVYAALRPFTRLVRVYAAGQKDASSEHARLLAEAGSMSTEHRVFGVEEAVEHHLDRQLHIAAKLRTRQLFLQNFTPNLYVGIGYAAILAGLAIGAQLDSAEIATLGAIVLLMLRSLGYGQTFQNTSQALAGAQPFIVELVDEIANFETSRPRFGDDDPGEFQSLAFTAATLGRAGTAILHGVDMEIRAGEAVGIVGPSGGGKSTLALAMLRLIEPSAGELRVNGQPARSCSEQWWQRHVAFVPQDPHLFEGTVLDNIVMHRGDVTRAAAERAARNAHLGTEIDTWGDGLDHHVGVSGNRLSGGQRQRLCIARALAGDPDILIFDEPTSALDQEAEASVTEVMADLAGSRTLIVIAHRLSTLGFCDRIISVDDAAVTELGSGRDLLQQVDP